MSSFISNIQQFTEGLPAATSAANPSSDTGAAAEPFAEALQQLRKSRDSTAPHSDTPDPARQAQAEKAAGQLISNALILPMLKQLRRSPWSENTVFSPGIGEKAFGPQFDMQISDRIADSPRLGLKTALVQRLLKRGPVTVPQPADLSAIVNAHARLDLHG
jgi:hypothetical protein